MATCSNDCGPLAPTPSAPGQFELLGDRHCLGERGEDFIGLVNETEVGHQPLYDSHRWPVGRWHVGYKRGLAGCASECLRLEGCGWFEHSDTFNGGQCALYGPGVSTLGDTMSLGWTDDHMDGQPGKYGCIRNEVGLGCLGDPRAVCFGRQDWSAPDPCWNCGPRADCKEEFGRRACSCKAGFSSLPECYIWNNVQQCCSTCCPQHQYNADARSGAENCYCWNHDENIAPTMCNATC